MSEIVRINIIDILPEEKAVLLSQGITSEKNIDSKIINVLSEAYKKFNAYAQPSGIYHRIEITEFLEIYKGEGENETRTPVGDIVSKALALALFAVTVGEKVTHEISRLFAKNDFALAAMLDSICSESADLASSYVCDKFHKKIANEKNFRYSTKALCYSPGYCGWHISGQKKLFTFLEPEKIGISLRESFLMNPLKSVSGVIIVGKPEIHRFDNIYPFCEQCETQSCLDRMN